MAHRSATAALPPRRAAPTAWADAIAALLGERPRDEDHTVEDARTVTAALQALVATGRAVATYPGQAVLPVTAVRATPQAEPGLRQHRRAPAKDAAVPLADTAFALQSVTATWIASVAALTVVPPRRGQPLDRAVVHLWLGSLKGVPFIHDDLPKALHFAGKQALLLADSDHDIEWLARDGVDVTQAEEIGRALRGQRERRGYVPPEERARKEQATAAVRAAYLAHRGPRPRALAQGDIDVIVREGLAQGLLISLDLVHAVTDGRGSPNAVYPKLADAMGRLAPRRPVADDIDPALRTLWTQLRDAAVAAATEALAPERAALAAERATLEAAEAALTAEREQDARAAAERVRHQEHLDAELANARDRIDSLVNIERGQAQDLARVTAERNALQGQLTDAGAALTALRTEHAAHREAHARALAAERDLTSAERDAAASARELATAQVRDLNERLAAARQETESKLTALQEAHQHVVTPLREALATAKRDTAAAHAKGAAAEQALAEARSAAAAASTKHATARAALEQRIAAALADGATVQRALSTLEGEHRAVVRERDRLDRLLARLQPAPEAH